MMTEDEGSQDKPELRSLTKEELIEELKYKLKKGKTETSKNIIDVLFEKKIIDEEKKENLLKKIDECLSRNLSVKNLCDEIFLIINNDTENKKNVEKTPPKTPPIKGGVIIKINKKDGTWSKKNYINPEKKNIVDKATKLINVCLIFSEKLQKKLNSVSQNEKIFLSNIVLVLKLSPKIKIYVATRKSELPFNETCPPEYKKTIDNICQIIKEDISESPGIKKILKDAKKTEEEFLKNYVFFIKLNEVYKIMESDQSLHPDDIKFLGFDPSSPE